MQNRRAFSIVIAIAACALPALADPQDLVFRGGADDDRDARSSFFVEGGGPGLFYSLNYERIEGAFGLRIGFSYAGPTSAPPPGAPTGPTSSLFAVPVMASYLGVTSGDHALELGAGATGVFFSGTGAFGPVASSGSGMVPLGTVLVGYRRQPLDGGLQFRVGLQAMVGKGIALRDPDPNAVGVLPWMYMSLGFSL
jgi:hypothetical protein